MKVYLDNSATTQANNQVIHAMNLALSEGYFNPSALYKPAVSVEKKMKACRDLICQELNAKGSVVFTSGGTEADNLAILGSMKRFRNTPGRILYSAGEHPAVIESCNALAADGFDVEEVALDHQGMVDLDDFRTLLTQDTQLICLMHINNETGAIQPIEQVAALRDFYCPNAFLHVDGVQGFIRLDCDVSKLKIDSFALSAHKFHGPKGVGALWVSDRESLSPITYGGGQERGLRCGTENTVGIAGLYMAIKSFPKVHTMRTMKLALYKRLEEAIPSLAVNGPDPFSKGSADHILNLSFPPVKAETMLHALEANNIYVGHGSACSSRKKQNSHVLTAMNIKGPRLDSAIRFSLNPDNNLQEIDYAADHVIKSFMALKQFVKR